MSLLILPLLWLCLIFGGLQFNKERTMEDPLSKNQTLAIRGICAIEIIIGHLSIYTGSEMLYLLRKADILFVGLFFLLSGYGTAYSFDKKDNYKKRFIIKKLIRLFVPAYLAHVVNNFHLLILYKNNCFIRDMFNPVMFVEWINWFIYELMAMYIIAYIAVKVGELKKTVVIIWIATVIFLISACIYTLDDPWYGCTLCYPLGVTYYLHKEQLDNILFRKSPVVKGFILLFFLITFSGIYIVFNDKYIIPGILARNLASVFFCLFVMLILTWFKATNKLSIWLGSISFELYLYHIPVIGIAVYYISNPLLCGIVALLGSVLLAFVMKKLWNLVFGRTPISL